MRGILAATMFAASLAATGFSPAHAQSYKELNDRGDQAMRSRDYVAAIDIYTRLLSMRTPGDPEDRCFLYWPLADAYGNGIGDMTKNEQAVKDSIACLAAIDRHDEEMNEFRAEALRILTYTYQDSGRSGLALPLIDQQEKLLPDQISYFEARRGVLLRDLGDFKAASAAYTRAAAGEAKAEDRARDIVNRAWVHMEAASPDEALADIVEAKRASPHAVGKEPDPIAWIDAELGRYDEAVASLRIDERAAGGNAPTFAYLRGIVEAASGAFDDAVSAFKITAASQATNPNIQVTLHLAELRAGQAGIASTLTTLASRLSPTKWPDAEVFYVLGKIDQSQFEAAASFGNKTVERNRQCEMNFVRGELDLIKGNTEGAKAALAKAVELCRMGIYNARIWAKGEAAHL